MSASIHTVEEQTSASSAPQRHWRERIFGVAALLFMAILAIGSFRHESPVYDEVTHIPSGLSYWQQHDARLNAEHPPLLKMIAVIPLLFTDVRAEYSDPSFCQTGWLECQWKFGRKFFSEWNAEQTERIVFLARLPMLALTLLLGWTVYQMARALAGQSGAALSLIVFVACPLYLGYGALVITDIGLCLFVVLTAWTFADLWQQPNWRKVMAFALSASAALLSKFSALLIVPSLLLFVVWMWWLPFVSGRSEAREGPSRTRALFAGVAVMLVVCYGFYWLSSFSSSPSELANARLASITSHRIPERILAFTTRFLSAHPGWEKPLQPLWLYLIGIGYLNAGLSRPVYLLGMSHGHGIWYYFPVVSFFKLAPGMLGLFALLAVLMILRRRQPAPRICLVDDANRARLRALLCVLIVFTIAALRSRLNIGIRHFSVPISISIILLALLVPLSRSLFQGNSRRLSHMAIILLALSCVVTALSAYPHYISYYNWFRLGAPRQEIVSDSNLDWGQSLPVLARFAAEHQIRSLGVDLMTPLPPETYLPGASAWECDNPQPPAPEYVAVSANFLLKNQPVTCFGLMRYQHWPVDDGTMYVFRITDDSYVSDARRLHAEHPDWSVAPSRFK
jgi:Dolichyl-phosphate-mannose-protein mannosyltransferase